MFSKEAIEELAKAQAISAAASSVDASLGAEAAHALVPLPSDFKVHDLESNLPNRRRARGAMETAVLAHFAAYVGDHKEEGATVFVNKAAMQATAVLNLGVPSRPGHADSLATYAPDKTAPYIALNALLNRSSSHGLTQRELAEFMEDWIDVIECYDTDEVFMPGKRAIDAVRKITIDSARKVESTEGQLSAERSALEKVAASSGGASLPTTITFRCEPHHGIDQRIFRLRLSVRTGDANKPNLSLTLRLVKAEQHAQDMADELAGKVDDALAGKAPVYVGSYSPK